MSKVHLEFLSWLAYTVNLENTGGKTILETIVQEGSTVRDLLNELATKQPRFEESVFDVKAQLLSERVSLFLNGQRLELFNGLDTSLRDGDTLSFVEPIVGG